MQFQMQGLTTMDHGLFIGGCFRHLSVAALFRLSASLLHKKLSGSHLDLVSSSLLSEFLTLFGLKTIL